MTTLLRLDASIRMEGSFSRAVADRLEASWCAAHPEGRVVVRDLAKEPPPHLDPATFEAFGGPPSPRTAWSDALIAELRQANDLLISTPLYNFGPPSALKAWVDQIVRVGHTFARGADGSSRPLLRGRTAYVVVARGGSGGGDGTDAATLLLPSLRRSLSLIGWAAVELIEVSGTVAPGAEARLDEALGKAQACFSAPPLVAGARLGQ